MKEMFGQPVFSVGEQTYCWEDVMIAAKLWGDYSALKAEGRQGAACLKKAVEINDALPRGAVESAASEFRYARDLITAQETQNWLARWGLSVEEWMGYFRRRLLRQKWMDALKEIMSEHAVTGAEVEPLIKVDAICSGRLGEWAGKLAGRAAIFAKLNEEAKEGPGALDEEIRDVLKAMGSEAKEKGFPGFTQEYFEQKIDSVARLEAAFRRFSKEAVTEKVIKDRIAAHYLDWIRFDCSYVSFTNELTAKEAAMCVREDGLELAEVAQDARRPFNRAVMYLDQVEPQLKEHLLAAQKGSLIGPVKSGDEYMLFWLIDKQMPSQDDPEIHRRAQEAILKSAVSHEINNRVRWLVRL